MDYGRIDVSNYHGEGYTSAEKGSAVALPMLIIMLLCITPTHRESLMIPD